MPKRDGECERGCNRDDECDREGERDHWRDRDYCYFLSFTIMMLTVIKNTKNPVKHLRSLESTQEARVALTHLSCSPNFPRTLYLDERTLTYEPIVK